MCFEQQSLSCQDVSHVDMDVTAEVVSARADFLESWPPQQSNDSNVRFMLWASFAEIYNEQIFDLLESSTAPAVRPTRPSTLQLRDGDGRPYISGLREVQVATAEEAWQLVRIGRENQHIAATRLNRASSRSHSIFMLRLIEVVDVDQPKYARVASLSFCDLAGSERSTAAGGCNERMKEAGNINLSLMMLGRCMEALRKNQTQRDRSTAAPRASVIVPFRDSRLTRMFQSFLCGEGRVVMITNVSPCANVFDETLHAVNYSALASQVLVGSCIPGQPHPTFLPVPAPSDKHEPSIVEKHETAPAVAKKKRKSTIEQETQEMEDGEDEDRYSSDEDIHESCIEERQKLVSAIKKLKDALAEEQQSKAELETQIRKEVCEEMQKQLVRIESEYQESIRRREEILEEKYDRKMEIYMEAVQKSCKRQRRDDGDDLPNVELHAVEMKLSKNAEEVKELRSKHDEMTKELAAARDNVSKLSSERDALAEKLTKAEFSVSDALRQEKIRTRDVNAELKNTVDGLKNKLSEAEHRHEVSCRQLRRDKAQLEQRLNAAEKLVANQDQLQEAGIDLDKAAKITELKAALKKEQETVHDLEQHLKSSEDDAKTAEKTWAQRCMEIEATGQEGTLELTTLREKYDSLEHNMQAMMKTSEEANQNHAQTKEALETLRSELNDKETQLKQSVSAAESLKEEIKHLTGERDAFEGKCMKLKTEIEELKQQSSVVVKDKVSVAKHEVSDVQEKLKQILEEKSASIDSLNIEMAKRTAQLMETKDELAAKVSEINQLEKQLDAEKAGRCQFGETLAECEKKLMESLTAAAVQKEKYSTLESLFETVKMEFSETKSALKAAQEENASYLSTIRSNDSEEKSTKEALIIVKEQLQQSDDREKTLQQQLSSSSQLVKELQEKDLSITTELADREEKLQTCHTTISDLRKMLEEEQKKSETALKDARSHEEVIETMKLALTEQELTMQTQDQTLRERDNEVHARLAELNASHVELDNLNDQIRQKNTKIHELETIVLTQDETLCKCDNEVQFLKAKNADLHSQTESFKTEMLQKKSRIRELEKEVQKVEKSRECLKKDVCDTTSELKTSERNLAEVKKELMKTRQELENLEREMQNLKGDTKKEMCAWREKRDVLVVDLEKSIREKDRLMAEKDKEILRLKAAEESKPSHSKREKHPSSSEAEWEMLQKKVEQLSRAASVKDQTIVDMKEQNLQLQHQICQLQHQENVGDAEEETRRRRGSRKSRLPTSRRMPLRVADGNADVSMGLRANVDLDETVHARESRRVRVTQKKSPEVVDEPCARAVRSCRKRTTSTLVVDSAIAEEEPEIPPQSRRLRSRHHC